MIYTVLCGQYNNYYFISSLFVPLVTLLFLAHFHERVTEFRFQDKVVKMLLFPADGLIFSFP